MKHQVVIQVGIAHHPLPQAVIQVGTVIVPASRARGIAIVPAQAVVGIAVPAVRIQAGIVDQVQAGQTGNIKVENEKLLEL